jgi:hypothetical protein
MQPEQSPELVCIFHHNQKWMMPREKIAAAYAGAYASWEQVAVGILQVQLNPQLMIGFSYDYPVGRMSTFSKGSSEFILRYEFGYKVSAANPRYF